jgi:two-component system sensor histidine kinase/response regulator
VENKISLGGKINELWVKLTGNPLAFSLEYRIFHSICIIIILSLAYTVSIGLLIGLQAPAFVCLATFLVFSYLYYRSRFKGKMQSSVVVCAVFANLICVVNYFFNSGINGPADLFIILTIILVISITPWGQHKIWLSVSIISALALHAIEYFYPKFVPYVYPNRSVHFLDRTSACLLIVIAVFYVTKYIRRNYDYERLLAEDKTHSIEDQNQFIMVQNQQLEEVNSEKNKLLSIIAHDLRAPLSNIQNYLELVTVYGLNNEEREVVESDLLKVTQSTLNMLSKLLIWSKSQMEGVIVKLSNLNLHTVLTNTLEMERMLAFKKEITLAYQIDPSIDIVADSDMLQLVVRNLVSNAIKFTQKGGIVEVCTEMLMGECKLSVKDNGNGIAYEQQPDIFSLKARSTFGTNNEKGVGLGLILCKEFTEQQGGRIGFESTPGVGSNFFIFIPLG